LKKALIVGGGIAGLTAAKYLCESNDWQVVLLEAQGELGGRIKTVQYGKQKYEHGANYLHIIPDDPLNLIIEEGGIELGAQPCSTFTDFLVIDNKGCLLDAKKVSRGIDLALDYINKAKTSKDPEKINQSITNFFQLPSEGDLIAARRKSHDHYLSSLVLTLICNGIGFCSPDKMALLDLLTDNPAATGKPLAFMTEPVIKIIHYLHECCIASEHYQHECGAVVSSISQFENGVLVESNIGEFSADVAIVTCPLATLKAETIRFNPTLPKSKQNAIDELGLGYFNKIILMFNKKEFPVEILQHDFLVVDCTTRNDSNNLGLVLAKVEMVAENPDQVILNGLVFGEGAKNEAKNLQTGFLQGLQRGFPELGNPLEVETTAWHDNPFISATHCYHPPGTKHALNEVLAEPFKRIYFAGDAAHSYQNNLNAACESGFNVARSLLEEGVLLDTIASRYQGKPSRIQTGPQLVSV